MQGERTGAVGAQNGRPTLADVAALAGVSIKTVSRVLNDEPSVSAPTAARVREAAMQLRYRRNQEAANLRRRWRTSVVGLVVDDVGSPAASRIARAAEARGRQHGYVLLVAMSGDDPAREEALLRAFCRRGVNGLLVVPTAGDHAFLRTEIAAGTPVVFIEGPGRNVEADIVVSDHAAGARAGVDHLLAAGHRRIAFLGGAMDLFTGTERQRGYTEAIERSGALLDPALVRLGLPDARAAEASTRVLLALPDPPTAVFAASTALTIGAVRAVQSAVTPVAVAGFDELDVLDLASVPVTVVAQDLDALGQTAIELLLRRIDGDPRPPEQVTLATELVTRGDVRAGHHDRTR